MSRFGPAPFKFAPGRWERSRLKELLRETSAKSQDGSETLLSVTEKRGVVPRMELLDEGDHLTRAESLEGYKIAEPGDLVVNIMLAWKRGLGVAWERGIVSPAYSVFRIRSETLEPRYLDYLIRSDEAVALMKSHSYGIVDSRLRIYPNTLLGLEVPIPTPHEQRAIASFLDTEIEKVDTLIEKKRRLLDLLEEMRAALITRAVTRGLDSDVSLIDSGVVWLGEIPEHWEVVRVKHLVTRDGRGLQMGPFGSMLKDLEQVDTGFRVYGQENTISGDFSRGHRWVAKDRFRALAKYQVSLGDILLTRKGSLGNAQLIGDQVPPGIIDSDTIRLRVRSQIIKPEFLALGLHSSQALEGQIHARRRGAVLSGLNSRVVGNLLIPVPPLADQANILEEVNLKTSKLRQLIKKGEEAISLLQEYRSALISAAVTGKIDVRDKIPA